MNTETSYSNNPYTLLTEFASSFKTNHKPKNLVSKQKK
jgi:hypothetical protein